MEYACRAPIWNLDTKKSIKTLEAEIKRLTGLNWLVARVEQDRGFVMWELMLPIACGKLKISAQSDICRAEELYGFHVESESDFFMKALKLIEIHK
jgi:hypothetical protein